MRLAEAEKEGLFTNLTPCTVWRPARKKKADSHGDAEVTEEDAEKM